jgi:hypothetical protein
MGSSVGVPLTLEDLTRAKYGDLAEAELLLIRAANEGKIAECSPKPQDPKAQENDPAYADSWGEQRKIRADVIRWLCVDADARGRIDPQGIWIHAAQISDELDLSFASVHFPLRFFNCSFPARIILAGANLRALYLIGSRTSVITAFGVKVEGDVVFENGFNAEGEVSLRGAEIGGNLACDNGSFKNPSQWALFADGVKVGGNVLLRDGFNAEGEVRLLGADIGGNLDCDNGSFKNPGQNALSADGVKVGGSILFRDGFNAKGAVWLVVADVSGNLECEGASFKNPGGALDSGGALNAGGVKVGGRVFLWRGFSAEGEVSLIGAGIGGDLVCDNGSFKNAGQNALSADRAKVGGGVFLRSGFNAEGEVSLSGANIGGDLDVTKAELGSTSINAERANVKGALYFREVARTSAEVGDGHTEICLRDASVGELVDDSDSWPDRGHLYLNGFVYDRIGEAPTDAWHRLNWLRKSMSFGHYQPQPYQQLAKVLRGQGHEAESVAILVGMQDDRRRYIALPWYAWLWSWVLRLTILYGYRPLSALRWILGFVALGFVIFGLSYRAGFLVSSDKNVSKPFCAAIYSFDTFVPVIDLGQKNSWLPSLTSKGRATDSWSGPVGRNLCDAAIVDVFPRSWMPSPTILSFFRWGYIVFGWFFATMFVAGITGLVRR